MELFFVFVGVGIWWFAIQGFNTVVETYMGYKHKIAVAQRDTTKYELEIARITSTK